MKAKGKKSQDVMNREKEKYSKGKTHVAKMKTHTRKNK